MALSNEQLLVLDTLIYVNKDCLTEGSTVADIVAAVEARDFHVDGCEMTAAEWEELTKIIKKDPVLLNYRVTNLTDDPKTGMRAACFVDDELNPSNVNVVFRGTSGDYEWHDNGSGGYLTDTEQQKEAAEYVNSLPEAYGNNMTVSGHSKGGNKAQYVTVVTDRVAKCVSYDGQGFSAEFIEKYGEEITKKAASIISICAENDYVNCLLYPIAGERVYIETEAQDNFLYYHKPNILLDENGNLRNRTKQSDLSKFITEYTTYMISNLDEPERSATIDALIDGVIIFLNNGDDGKELLSQLCENTLNHAKTGDSFIQAAGNAVSHLDDFALHRVGDRYGMPARLAMTYVLAVGFPSLFMDDLMEAGKELAGTVFQEMVDLAGQLDRALQQFGQKAAELGKRFVSAVATFAGNVRQWMNKNFNAGYKYASSNTLIKVDTGLLRSYADRLGNINRRVSSLDGRMDSLYTKVGLADLWSLLQADLLTGYSFRLNRCISYLNETASDFENVERTLASQL